MVEGVGLGFNIELLTLVKLFHLLTDEVRPSFQFIVTLFSDVSKSSVKRFIFGNVLLWP